VPKAAHGRDKENGALLGAGVNGVVTCAGRGVEAGVSLQRLQDMARVRTAQGR